MLIISRRRGETVVIGTAVKITILEVGGNQVRVGVQAPKNVEVHRLEIYDRIQDCPVAKSLAVSAERQQLQKGHRSGTGVTKTADVTLFER